MAKHLSKFESELFKFHYSISPLQWTFSPCGIICGYISKLCFSFSMTLRESDIYLKTSIIGEP